MLFGCLDQMKHSLSCLIYYFSDFGYQMEHSFSCFIYYFSVFGHQMEHSFSCFIYYFPCLDIRWNTPSRVWYITSRCLEYIRWNTFLVFNILLLAFWIYAIRVFRYQTKHSFLCLMYYFSVFGYQMELLLVFRLLLLCVQKSVETLVYTVEYYV